MRYLGYLGWVVSVGLGWLKRFAVLGSLLGVVLLIGGWHQREPDASGKDQPFAQVAHDDSDAIVWALALSPDARYLASATIPGDVRIKDLATGQSLRIQSGPWSSARSLGFAPDGRILAVSGNEPVVRLWDAQTGVALAPVAVGMQGAKHLAFSPDGTLLAVSGRGGEYRRGVVALWDWTGRRRRAFLEGGDGSINTLAFSADSSGLLTGDSLGVLRLWDVATGRERTTFRANARGTLVQAAAFSPDGSLLATAGFLDPEVRLWDTATGERRGIVPGTALGVNALAFAPDGTMLVLAQGDGTLTCWKLAEGRVAGSVAAPGGSLQSVAFSRDGRVLVTGGADGVVRHWEVAQALGGRPPGDRAGTGGLGSDSP